jgi:hypothetical protein
MLHVLQVLFLPVFLLQVVMHGEESQVPGDLRPRSSFATIRNRVANDICVPRKILRDTPDLSYVQPEGNCYFKTSDSYQILKSCSINISDCLKSPGTCDSSPCTNEDLGKISSVIIR